MVERWGDEKHKRQTLCLICDFKSLHVKNAVSESGKAICIAIGYDKNKKTHKLQIIAQARLPQVTTSARKLPVGKQLNLALTKQRLLLSIGVKLFFNPQHTSPFYLTVTFTEGHVHKTKENKLTLEKFGPFINNSVLQVV